MHVTDKTSLFTLSPPWKHISGFALRGRGYTLSLAQARRVCVICGHPVVVLRALTAKLEMSNSVILSILFYTWGGHEHL